LLYVGSRAREAQAWVEEDADFVEEAERDGQSSIKGKIWYGFMSRIVLLK
jgi:hypothetical protein